MWAQLGDLLVHRNGFNKESRHCVSIPDLLEATDCVGVISDTGVEVADRVQDGKVLRVLLDALVVFGDCGLQLALLDELLRRAEDLRLVEAKPECHRLSERIYSSMLPQQAFKSPPNSLLLSNPGPRHRGEMGPQMRLKY